MNPEMHFPSWVKLLRMQWINDFGKTPITVSNFGHYILSPSKGSSSNMEYSIQDTTRSLASSRTELSKLLR